MRVLRIVLKVIIMLAVVTLLVMLLWNWLIPLIFHGPVISYFEALGLLVLAKLLLAFPMGRGFGHRHRYYRSRYWKELEEKMAGMSEEEREKFKAELKNKCHWH